MGRVGVAVEVGEVMAPEVGGGDGVEAGPVSIASMFIGVYSIACMRGSGQWIATVIKHANL